MCVLTTLYALNPYNTLGVSRSADVNTINKAVERMSVLYHNDSYILGVIKDAHREIKMYQSLDRGVFKPKRNLLRQTGKQAKASAALSISFFKWTAVIFMHLLPVTFLLFCLFRRPKVVPDEINSETKVKD